MRSVAFIAVLLSAAVVLPVRGEEKGRADAGSVHEPRPADPGATLLQVPRPRRQGAEGASSAWTCATRR